METEAIKASIASIRDATDNDATPDVRARGIAACRALLTWLEGSPRSPPVPTHPPVDAMARIAGSLQAMSAEQLLDLTIARMRAALPAGVTAPAVAPLTIKLVPTTRRG